MIAVFDTLTGNQIASYPVLDSSEAVQGTTIYHFASLDTGTGSSIAIYKASATGLKVSILDIVSGDEIFSPQFSATPNEYRNASSSMRNLGASDTRELVVVLEDASTGEHKIEIRDLATSELLGKVEPVSGRNSGGAFGVLTILALLIFASRRSVRLFEARASHRYCRNFVPNGH
jgi:hypothetical protein